MSGLTVGHKIFPSEKSKAIAKDPQLIHYRPVEPIFGDRFVAGERGAELPHEASTGHPRPLVHAASLRVEESAPRPAAPPAREAPAPHHPRSPTPPIHPQAVDDETAPPHTASSDRHPHDDEHHHDAPHQHETAHYEQAHHHDQEADNHGQEAQRYEEETHFHDQEARHHEEETHQYANTFHETSHDAQETHHEEAHHQERELPHEDPAEQVSGEDHSDNRHGSVYDDVSHHGVSSDETVFETTRHVTFPDDEAEQDHHTDQAPQHQEEYANRDEIRAAARAEIHFASGEDSLPAHNSAELREGKDVKDRDSNYHYHTEKSDLIAELKQRTERLQDDVTGEVSHPEAD